MTVSFTDRIDVLEERLVARGFAAATVEVTKQVKVTAVDPHLASWYGEELDNTSIREKQTTQVLQFASNYASSYSTDMIIIAGDYNSSPNTPVYNMMTADGYVDSLVDKLGAGATADVTYA